LQLQTFDTETHLIKPGCGAPRLVCLSTHQGELMLRDDALDYAEQQLRDPNVILIGQWVFFDLAVLCAEAPERFLPLVFAAIDANRIRCTKIRQMMIDNARGELKYVWDSEKREYKKQGTYHLFMLVLRHLGENIQASKEGPDIWRLRYNELDGIPIGDGRCGGCDRCGIDHWPPDAISYAISDSTYTHRVFQSQMEEGEPPGELSQIQAAWALYLIGLWGAITDGLAVDTLRDLLQGDWDEQAEVAKEYEFMRANGKRHMAPIKAAVEKWYTDKGRKVPLSDSGKNISTSRETLTGTDNAGLLAVSECVRIGKVLSTYVPALERGREVAINASYNPIIETYRTSCSGGMKINKIPLGVNWQNPPRQGGVRECVIARPGFVFVFCDYDTLEMRSLAQVCLDLFGHSEIAKAIQADQDLHVALAADMLGLSYEEGFARFEDGDTEIAEARQFCKIGNYGFSGGMGPHAFRDYAKGYGIEVSLEHATRLRDGFRAKWTEMPMYFDHCSELANTPNREAEVVEFVRSGMLRGKVRYTAICNGYFQHLAAMGAKAALYQTVKEMYLPALQSPLYGSRGWLFAHDEIGMEVPLDAIGRQAASDSAQRLNDVMIEEMQKWCPDVPIGASGAMTRRWYKGAKPVYIDGCMVPSKPEKYKDDNGKIKTRWVHDPGID
jgi:hypothetical protein